MSKKRVCLSMRISRMALWKIEQRYKKWGEDGLKDHKPGRLFEPLSNKFYSLTVQEWKRYKCGARKLHAIFKKKGFKVSRRKIEQVLVKEGFQKPFPKRKKPRRYKRYEWPLPNYMWHTDWHVIKAEKHKGENIIVYLDDCSRKAMGYCKGAENTKNSLFALYAAIAENLAIPFILNSDRGTQFFPNKKDKKGKAMHEFQEALAELGIIFVPSKRRHPQTNGKMEKWFDTLKKRMKRHPEESLQDFVKWYNNGRIHHALAYKTPEEVYLNKL